MDIDNKTSEKNFTSMTQEEYINQHPEQFKDSIDKCLFLEFGILGSCCSAEKSHEYYIARMVVERMIYKAVEWLKSHGGFTIGFDGATVRDFRKAMEE